MILKSDTAQKEMSRYSWSPIWKVLGFLTQNQQSQGNYQSKINKNLFFQDSKTMKAVLAGVALLVLLANCSGASGSRGLLGKDAK